MSEACANSVDSLLRRLVATLGTAFEKYEGKAPPLDRSKPAPPVGWKRRQVELYLAQKPLATNLEVAGELGLCPSYISKVRNIIGKPSPRGRGKGVGAEALAKIEDLLRDNPALRPCEVIRETGLSPTHAKRLLEKAKGNDRR